MSELDAELWERAKGLFSPGLGMSPGARAEYLDRACGEDEALRELVQSLWDADKTTMGDSIPTAPEGARESSPIGQTIRHYRVLSELGRGGMGVVYKAQDIRLGRMVALKFLPGAWSRESTSRERIVREAKAAARLEDPRIGTVYGIDETEDGTLFIAMAYWEGRTLEQRLDKGPIPLDQALEIAIEVAGGLDAAHRVGVIHRDIKPSNILLTEEGAVKILDFGIAYLKGETRLTRTGASPGTITYMSPEQIRGEKVEPSTDLWSLGVVLYQMVSGRPPFEGRRETAMYGILNEDPEPLALETGPPSRELEGILAGLLDKSPRQRYQSASELQRDLKALRDGRRDSMRARRVGRRPKRLGLAAGMVLAVILVLAGLAVWKYRAPAPVAEGSVEAVVVLPFDNLMQGEQDYFVDGITDELIGQLGRIRGFKRVISRTSAMSFKGVHKPLPVIGRELGVDAVIEGSVLVRGERVRVSVRLLKVDPERLVWSSTYIRDLADVMGLQGELAREIAERVRIEIRPDEVEQLSSVNRVAPEAHDLYLRAVQHENERTEDGIKGTQLYERALAIQPDFALALVGLARSYQLMVFRGVYPRAVGRERARAAVRQALTIDPVLPEAHVEYGRIKLQYDWDWAGAEEHLRKAVEYNPNLAMAHHRLAWHLALHGLHEESLQAARRALELDPLSVNSQEVPLRMLFLARRYEEALQEARTRLQVDQRFVGALRLAGMSELMLGRFAAALADLEETLEIAPDSVALRADLAYARALAGSREEAEGDLGFLQSLDPPPHYEIAIVQTGLGHREDALDSLDLAFESRAANLVRIKVDPRLDALRAEPRVQDLLESMNFGIRETHL